MAMRMFLNAIFDFKPKNNAFVTIPPALREVLREGGWTPERFLFDLYDINEASSEGRTPHAMMMKRFPQLRPYWHNTSERFAAMNTRTVFSDAPIPPTRSFGYGFFSNFPGRREGTAVFWPEDPAIDMDVLEQMCAAIGRNFVRKFLLKLLSSQPNVIELRGISIYRRTTSWKSHYLSAWVEPIIERAIIFYLIYSHLKAFLLISGVSDGNIT